MIIFNNCKKSKPFLIFREKYEEALNAGQRSIEAISISSFNSNAREVESRFVNLKFVNKDNFIFFSNYNSPKSQAFKSHGQIAALIYWSKINTQIRIKATIKKTSAEFNQEYFKNRDENKNALAISSNQSKKIKTFDEVIKKFNKTRDKKDLSICPSSWGGFSFQPYEFEFWIGGESRLNKRDLYKISNSGKWDHFVLEP